MIEVTDRWGLAKTGKWSQDDKEVRFPNVFFFRDSYDDEDNEVKLSLDEKLEFKVPNSFFSSLPDEEGNFPSTFAYPQVIGGRLVDSKGGNEKIQVLYGQEPRPDAELYVLGNAPELLQRSERLFKRVVELRKKIPFHKLLYAPGIAQPQYMALLAYMGVDMFDSAAADYYSAMNIDLSDWKGFDDEEGQNREALRSELKLVRRAVSERKIRELVETRVRSEPWLVEVLRLCDIEYSSFEKGVPVTGGSIEVTTREGLHRPDIRRFRRRMKERYVPPERNVLLLLPCSARKPYFRSRTHGLIRSRTKKVDWTDIHELILTSPMGAVPREIEMFYPAQQYDIPVSERWFQEEKEIILSMLKDIMNKGDHSQIISHLPGHMDFVTQEIDCIDTVKGCHPTSSEALDRLEDTLKGCDFKEKNVDRFLEGNLSGFARFQFGEAGEELVKESTIEGRYPYYKIMRDGDQLGMLVDERGLISLTLEGAAILKEKGTYTAEIDDFRPKGSVFAVGVKEADQKIRPEDEVVVVHQGELRGVGPAAMSGPEMEEADRGEAIRIRHYV